MRFSDLLRMSLSSLFKRKVRTILTVLGVVIGTASIVVMMSLGLGLNRSIMSQMESYGSLTAIQVSEANSNEYMTDNSASTSASGSSTATTEKKRLDDALVKTISEMDHVTIVSPVLQINVIAKCGKYLGNLNLQGMSVSALEKMGIPVGEGTLPADTDELQLLFGNQVLTNFYNPKNDSDSYWSSGKLPDIDLMKDNIFYIFDTDAYYQYQSGTAGVASPKKMILKASGIVKGGVGDYNEYSYNVYCNITALKTVLQKVFKNKVIPGQPTTKSGKPYKEIYYNQIYVNVDNVNNVKTITDSINALGYQAYSNSEWVDSEKKTLGIIQAVLGGIGAVSLLVAAIGIANTMMMSIYERTKEIGVMKVLGCDLHNIQSLFLFEAAYIGLIGGIVGLGLSYLISFIMNHVVDLSNSMGITGNISYIPFWLAGVSIAFATVVGMVSGYFPSRRAMKLSPLAAIHNE